VGRKLYSRGFFGNELQRDRKAERARDGISGIPARPLIMLLVILALILVIASAVGH
jgi:hypothetical protein